VGWLGRKDRGKIDRQVGGGQNTQEPIALTGAVTLVPTPRGTGDARGNPRGEKSPVGKV